MYGKNSSENIHIEKKEDKPGIDIYIKEGTKNESMHIPVILSQSGLKELVYNDFHIGAGCDVTIVAGCGIHNDDCSDSEHNGVHRFFLEEGAKVTYVEKHYGEGDGRTTFNLPDKRGRVAEMLNRDTNLGDKLGSKTHKHLLPFVVQQVHSPHHAQTRLFHLL